MTDVSPGGTVTPDSKKQKKNKKNFDHDGFWKDLIERFFYHLLKRALPELYEKADRTIPPRFLDKEFRDILNTADPKIHTSPHFADFVLEVPLIDGDTEWVILHLEARVPRAWVQFKHKCLFGMPMLRKEVKCKSMPHLCCEGW
jgi:hypothetical protein